MTLEEAVAKAKREERDRVFYFLDYFNLMDKEELRKFKNAYPYIQLPEEQRPLTPQEREWAEGVIKRFEERKDREKGCI